jgi:hypothetical protein
MRPLCLLVLVGCGRISFDPITGQGSNTPVDAPPDGPTDGPPGDAMVRACQSDNRYVGAAGLANTYREATALVSWDAARADCIADEADLWVVENTTEQLAFTGDWTGITDVAAENVWRKVDGTVATFLPFAAGEPDGADIENCIRTDVSGFEDRDCGDARDYVCECPKP